MARQNVMLRDAQSGITVGSSFDSETTGSPEGYKTVLRAKGSAVLPDIPGGASLGVGLLAMTLPAGRRVVGDRDFDIAIQQTDGNIDADTPEVGLGTTIASGANATLGDVHADAENLVTGVAASDCDGTSTAGSGTTPLVIESGDDHTIYLNVADGWAASGDDAAAVSGEITIRWR